MFISLFELFLFLIKTIVMTNFDTRAKEWDNDPVKTERARALADQIREIIHPAPPQRGFEFGCGTGMLSFELKDSFGGITLADTSTGMIDVLIEKIGTHHITNFEPMLIDLLESDREITGYDAVFTLMTLHHVPDTEKALIKFNRLLRIGGHCCIADLVSEDGSFHLHDPAFDGYNGFDAGELASRLEEAGFRIVHNAVFFELKKEYNGDTRKYPLFLIVGEKIQSV